MTGQAWPARYEIRVGGVLDSRWADWFGSLAAGRDGSQTVISVLLADQAALHGLLASIGDLGLGLISARRLDPDQPGDGPQPRDARGDVVPAVTPGRLGPFGLVAAAA